MGISLSVDDVREVARATRGFAAGLEPEDRLEPTKVVPEALTALAKQPSVPGAQQVITVHAGAREVVAATLDGVKEDLFAFAKLLEDSVSTLHESEALVERALKVDLELDLDDDTLSNIGNGDGPSHADARREETIANRDQT